MQQKIVFFAVIGAIVGSTSLLGFRAARSAGATEQAAADVRTRTILTSSKLAAVETRRSLAAQAQERLHAGPDRGRAAPSALSDPTVKRVVPSPGPSTSKAEDLMEEAKLQLLSIAAKQVDFAITHGPFFRSQRLTPQQIEKLAGLLARHDAMLEDVAVVARSNGLPSNDSAIVALRNEAVAELRAPGTELLGESGYAALQEYERTVPVRAFVGRIAGLAALTGDQLTPAQAEDLTRVLTAASSVYVNGGKAELGGVNWTQADAAALAVLSPTQFEIFSRTAPPGAGPSRWRTLVSRATARALQAYAQTSR